MIGHHRRTVALALTIVALATLPACRPLRARTAAAPDAGTAIPVGPSTRQIDAGGRTRTFHLYRPDSLPAAAPLVVMLHGGFGTGAQAESDYGWDALADREHFLVAYPDGVDRAWNVGGGCCGVPASTGVDDVGFVTTMVDAIAASTPVDRKRVYATGISNGGMLAYRLACDTDVFAAIGPDSATLLGPCPSPSPLSVLHIHGTADHNIPYDGSGGIGFARIDGPAVPDVVAAWRRTDGCADPVTSVDGDVTTATATCPDGRVVELVTIAGAGHQWPGSRDKPVVRKVLGLDAPSTAFDATSLIWGFFAAHHR